MASNSSALSTTTIVVWIVVVVVVIIVVVVLIVVDNVDVVSKACVRDHDVDHGGEHEGEADVDHEGAEGEEGKDASVAAATELNHLGKYDIWININTLKKIGIDHIFDNVRTPSFESFSSFSSFCGHNHRENRPSHCSRSCSLWWCSRKSPDDPISFGKNILITVMTFCEWHFEGSWWKVFQVNACI